ncbi:MAG: chemotaxis protein CheA, partial [Steroidobacterales bacterium]
MPPRDEQFLKRLLATFRVEAQEHLQAIAAGLIELEKSTDQAVRAAVLDRTFRAAHSLKGAARTVKATDVESLCQALESAFAAIKRGDAVLSAELFDHLHRMLSALGSYLQLANSEAVDRPKTAEVIRALQSALMTARASARPRAKRASTPMAAENVAHTASAPAADQRSGSADTVRVVTERLDAVVLQAEEMLSAKSSLAQCATSLRRCETRPAAWRKRWAKLQPDLRSLRHAQDRRHTHNGGGRIAVSWARVHEFLEWNRDFIDGIESELTGLAKAAKHDERALGSMVDGLLDEMKGIVTQPFATLLDVFPRFVRELSRDLGKEAELVLRGADIEIDRRVLQELKDPLTHLVRNALHHGIEMPDVRRRAGKPSRGALTIDIGARDGNRIEISLIDDGAGIDAEAVKARALKLGTISGEQAQALGGEQLLSLVFHSGVSTSPVITDISGRGLGLAIVSEMVQKLGGTLSVKSVPDRGTTFQIVLPLSLARFRGVLVRSGGHQFVLPTRHVERVLRIRSGDIKTVENRATILESGRTIALARLAAVLGIKVVSPDNGAAVAEHAVQVAVGEQRIAFIVDEVVDEREVLVKSLGRQLQRVRNLSGATILGPGRVVPILNVADLMKS